MDWLRFWTLRVFPCYTELGCCLGRGVCVVVEYRYLELESAAVTVGIASFRVCSARSSESRTVANLPAVAVNFPAIAVPAS